MNGTFTCDVLVVDDDASSRAAITLTLTDAGLHVEATGMSDRALELMHGGLCPSAILLNLDSPAGTETHAAVRADPVLGYLPTVVATAKATLAPTTAVAVLKKPFAADTLLRALWPLVRGTTYSK